ncbi:DUF4397 domain-containing protein [Persicimonas caeni]|uniref:DUF4397 domain-containing protein n=1 Tax=Persicimonas caeni TaxID=2292766 RepID=A0A4Y6PQN9_PERCE|nr:DUF4397 domain-containing protein [Persicimonas caeni]QDG50095.1 DUF4397 domain-containing protein [Persicimonas caeni]QED31316.1 DUF4397 domain-containing protein [Persicimonas caeni]
MSNRLIRFLMYGLLCMSLTAAACGDDPAENNDANNEPAECTTADDCQPGQSCINGQCTGEAFACTEATEAEDCAGDEICVNNECIEGCRTDDQCSDDLICLADNTCGCNDDTQCSGDDICVDGACEAPAPLQCADATVGGELDCDPSVETDEAWECVDVGTGPKCYAACEPGRTGDNVCVADQRSTCPSGQFCVNQLSLPNFCFPSQCQGPQDLASCDSFETADSNDFGCYPAQGGAYICQEGGTLAEGEACGEGVSEDCGAGLLCGLDSTCVPLCDEDTDCSGEQRCIGEGLFFEGFDDLGICGEGCDPFSSGQCGEGQICNTISADDGLCADAVEEPTEAYGSCDGYIRCNDSSDCPNGATCGDGGTCQIDRPSPCAEGTQCVTLSEAPVGQAGEGRCLPLCDTSNQDASQEQLDATCPGGDASAFGRFIHLAQGAGDVDIYVNDALVIDNRATSAGATTVITRDFVELPLGDVTIDVVAFDAADNSNPVASLQTRTKVNEQDTYAIVNNDSAVEIIAVDVPRDVADPATGEAKVRIAHTATAVGNVDVYVVADGATVTTGDTPVADDLAFGDVTAFTSIPAGDYDAVVFQAGAAVDTASPLVTLDVTVAADTTVTAYAWGANAVSAAFVEYTEAAVTMTGGFCYNSGDDVGICFQRCEDGSEGYAQGQCSNTADACTPFGGDADVCWASTGAQAGESCDPSRRGACGDGLFCRAFGDGTGVCANYCQPGEQTNPELGCPSTESCQAISGEERNLGECGIECDPSGFPSDPSDSSCPDGLQNCLPYDIDDQGNNLTAYCSASGDLALGADCGDVTVENCAPGAVCRRDASMLQCSEIPQEGTILETLYGPVGGLGNVDGGTCRQTCELFADDCPEGQGCMINALEASAQVGFCMPEADELTSIGANEPCPWELSGMMCGDGSVCTTFTGGVARCVQFCDVTDGSTCTGDLTCQPFFTEQDKLGACFPPEN